MLTKKWRVKYVHKHHTYDKNNAVYVIFFRKFDLYYADFQSLFLQIIRVWKLFFSCKLFMSTTENRSSA